jgi:hypothetical protein
MGRPAKLLLPALALLWGAGCKEEPSPENDRTLARLKQEADRQAAQGGPGLQRGAPASEDPNDKLAKVAANAPRKPPEESGAPVRLPDGNATVHVGQVAVKLLGMRAGQTEGRGAVTLSTDEQFLHAHLVAQNVGPRPAKLDLTFVRISAGAGVERSLARDVQRLVGTRELAVELAPDERQEFDLYFEVPREGPGKGWSLTLPAAVGGEQDVSIPLG